MEVAKQAEIEKEEFDQSEIEYVSYGGEHHLPLIMRLVDDELSEPYSIFTYRYFVYLWPQLCFLAFHRGRCIGTVVCKMGDHRHTFRGYIAMLVVINPYRGRGIATELVTRSIKVMMESGCEEVAKVLWDCLFWVKGEYWVSSSSFIMHMQVFYMAFGSQKHHNILWRCAFLSIFWLVWLEQNDRVFHKRVSSIEGMWEHI